MKLYCQQALHGNVRQPVCLCVCVLVIELIISTCISANQRLREVSYVKPLRQLMSTHVSRSVSKERERERERKGGYGKSSGVCLACLSITLALAPSSQWKSAPEEMRRPIKIPRRGELHPGEKCDQSEPSYFLPRPPAFVYMKANNADTSYSFSG